MEWETIMILKNDKHVIRVSSIKSDYYIEAESRADSDTPHFEIKFNFKSINDVREVFSLVEDKLNGVPHSCDNFPCKCFAQTNLTVNKE